MFGNSLNVSTRSASPATPAAFNINTVALFNRKKAAAPPPPPKSKAPAVSTIDDEARQVVRPGQILIDLSHSPSYSSGRAGSAFSYTTPYYSPVPSGGGGGLYMGPAFGVGVVASSSFTGSPNENGIF